MFHKPFRVKSQTAIKGSDRKKVRGELGKQFPELGDDVLKELVPNKEEMTVMKIYTHGGDNIIVYCLLKNPAFFEIHQKVYPTVYTLWKHPELLPVFTTWPPVFKKLTGGADLMLPGVVVPGQVTPHTFGNLGKNHPCSVKLLGNKCPVAVGKTALSGSDIYESGMRGKGVIILHTYQDHLWAHGDKSDPPLIGDPEAVAMVSKPPADDEENSEVSGASYMEGDGESPETDVVDGAVENGASGDAEGQSCDVTDDNGLNEAVEKLTVNDEDGAPKEEDGEAASQETAMTPEMMDELLYQCCLHSLKTNVKKADLPLLTSKFFRSHLVPCCPRDKTLDLKKSSYKKLSKFLKHMQKEGYLVVKELSKGVESIVEVHRDHTDIRSFKVPESFTTEEPEGATAAPKSSQEFVAPTVTELHCVSAATLPLFRLAGYSKGKALPASEVRQAIKAYVTSEDLDTRRGSVTLDPVLADVLLNKGEYAETLMWEDLYTRCLSKMNLAHQLVVPGHDSIIKKGKIEPITVTVAQRAGNKKVTLIENLEVFGLDPEEFAHQVQVGVACSTSVSPLPGKNRGMQVLVQGNQCNYVGKMLLEKYKIPRKFVVTPEKGPKQKGKR